MQILLWDQESVFQHLVACCVRPVANEADEAEAGIFLVGVELKRILSKHQSFCNLYFENNGKNNFWLMGNKQ